ncbi:MAG: hypothetical protein K2M07_08430 [Muribaculaceae bacterium]|nr:hypothetical protein [Muribaculaceae bacterium]
MNEFEKRMNELRRQFKAEQRSITKDANRTIGRLNTAILQVHSVEAREAMRTEKERVYESMRRSHELNKTCYLQQLELLNDQYISHLRETPSNRQLRHMVAHLCRYAESNGKNSLCIPFGENRRAEVIFN